MINIPKVLVTPKNDEIKPFHYAKTPITIKQYKEFLNSKWYKLLIKLRLVDEIELYGNGDGRSHPITHINYYEAELFCKWVGGRLPTEYEYMAAAVGRTGKDEYGTPKDLIICREYINQLQPVVDEDAEKRVNDFGLIDLAGNCWEWTSSDDANGRKIIRGGSWGNDRRYAQAAHRRSNDPASRYLSIGFRPIWEVK